MGLLTVLNEVAMRDPKTLPRFKDILEQALDTPEKRREFDLGMDALRFGLQVALRCEELGLTPEQVESFSGISPAALLKIQTGTLPDAATQTKLARALQARIIVEPSGQWKLEAAGVALAA